MAASARGPVAVTVWGHSFVRRLRDHVAEHPRCPSYFYNLGITHYPCNVTFKGTGGLTLAKARKQLRSVCASNPEIVIIDIGSNDLCDPFVTVPELVDGVMALAQHLLDNGVRFVYFLPIIPRLRTPHSFYNTIVQHYSTVMKMHCQNHDSLHFWFHKPALTKNQMPVETYFLPDGVHLNRVGISRYHTSVRGAVLYAVKRIYLV